MPLQLRTDGSDSYTPTPEDTPWHRLGGSDAVKALAEAFYDDMEVHEPALTAVHHQEPEGKVSRRSRERFGLFLIGWLAWGLFAYGVVMAVWTAIEAWREKPSTDTAVTPST
jgi:hypothetical protein